jgi:hypothetical protein
MKLEVATKMAKRAISGRFNTAKIKIGSTNIATAKIGENFSTTKPTIKLTTPITTI